MALVVQKYGGPSVADAERIMRVARRIAQAKAKGATKGISVQGRSTQGVTLMRLGHNDKVVAITCFGKG